MKKLFLVIISIISVITVAIYFIMAYLIVSRINYTNSKIPDVYYERELYCEQYNIKLKKIDDKKLFGKIQINEVEYNVIVSYHKPNGNWLEINDDEETDLSCDRADKIEFKNNKMIIELVDINFSKFVTGQENSSQKLTICFE